MNKVKNLINKIKEYIKNNPNIVKIVGGALVACLLLFIFIIKGDNKYEGLTIDENALIIVKDDGKYGYINNNGKVIIKPQYEQASSFNGNYAVVSDGEKYKLIDKKGKVKFEVDYASKIKYVSDYNVWIIEDTLYNSKLKRISKKGVTVTYEKYGILKWKNADKKTTGIMNYKGKVLYSTKLEDDSSYLSVSNVLTDVDNDINVKNKYCLINISGKKYAILNCNNGKSIYKMTENTINNTTGTIFEIVDKEKELVEKIIILKNKIVYRTDSKDSTIKNMNNYYIIDDDKYISKTTGKKITKKPSDLDEDYDASSAELYLNYKKYQCENSYGIKKGNKVTVKCEWDRIKFFDIVTTRYLKSKNKYYALAKKDDKYYLINIKNGKKIAEFNTDSISTYSTSMFITYKDSKENKKYVYNLVTKKSKEFNTDSVISLYQNYFTIKDDKTEYYNSKFKMIYSN